MIYIISTLAGIALATWMILNRKDDGDALEYGDLHDSSYSHSDQPYKQYKKPDTYS